MKSLTIALCLLSVCSLPRLVQAEPSASPSKAVSKAEAQEVAEMEKQLATAIEKYDTAALEKILRDDYFDAYEGDKRAMTKRQSLERCKKGWLKYLAIVRDSKTSRQDDVVAVEGDAKLIPNVEGGNVPTEQWVHVQRLWKKADGKWILTAQIRRLEGDDGKGEED